MKANHPGARQIAGAPPLTAAKTRNHIQRQTNWREATSRLDNAAGNGESWAPDLPGALAMTHIRRAYPALSLAGILLAAAPALGGTHHRIHATRHHPAKAAVVAEPAGPAPVVLGGKVPLPSDVPPPPALPDVASYVLVDDATGTVIAEKAPHVHLPPASLAKLMTAYLTYRALKAGTIHLDQSVPVSAAAWKTMGSRMFIEPTKPVTIKQLIAGLMIDSGNDAAVALAQAVAGTRASFVAMMQRAAATLPLTDTHYTNVDGLPDPGLYTSAADVARLSRVLIKDYPQILAVTKQQHYTYNNITQRNWNPVVFRDPTVDGLKTGLTDESGHCIAATALRDGRRLIAVVMGGPSWHQSADDIEALLDYGYHFFTDRTVLTADDTVGEIKNPLMRPRQVAVGVRKRLVMVLPASKLAAPTVTLELTPGLRPPIAADEVVGTVAIGLSGAGLASLPAVALSAAEPAGFAQRLIYRIRNLW